MLKEMGESMCVLVTGATGLLGRQVMSVLGEVDGLRLKGTRFSRGEVGGDNRLVRLDLTDLKAVSTLLEQVNLPHCCLFLLITQHV